MKRRDLVLLSAAALSLTEARAAELHAFAPVVRTGDRLASAPVLIGKFMIGPNNSPTQSQFCAFQTGPGSKPHEKGQYVLELEGTGAKGQVRVFFRRVDKQEANYRASHAVGDLRCSVKKGVEPVDRPGAVKGVVQPEDRPRTLNELGFRANAAAHAQDMGASILLQIRGLDPPPPNPEGVSQCIMKVTLRAAK